MSITGGVTNNLGWHHKYPTAVVTESLGRSSLSKVTTPRDIYNWMCICEHETYVLDIHILSLHILIPMHMYAYAHIWI